MVRFDLLSAIGTAFLASFYLYWAIAAIGVKKDVPQKGRGGKWALARLGLIALITVAYHVPVFSSFWNSAEHLSFFESTAIRLLGVTLTALGVALAIWARRHLGRNWSAQPAKKIGHELVITGPYRFVRHPIYTGILTAWFGFGLINGPG